jgi:hypothetical protein
LGRYFTSISIGTRAKTERILSNSLFHGLFFCMSIQIFLRYSDIIFKLIEQIVKIRMGNNSSQPQSQQKEKARSNEFEANFFIY